MTKIEKIQDFKKKQAFMDKLAFNYIKFLKDNSSDILLDNKQREFWLYDTVKNKWFKRVEGRMSDGINLYDEVYNFLIDKDIFEPLFTSTGRIGQEIVKMGAMLVREGKLTPPYAKDRYHNLKNGIYDSKKHKLIPHTSKIFTDYQYPFSIDINKDFVLEDYPLLNKLFTGALGDDDKIIDKDLLLMMSQLFGTMISPTRYPVMYVLIGEQGTAKSTFAGLLFGFVGKNRSGRSPLENFAGNKHNKFGNHKAVVGNKLNISEEISEEKLNASNLKTLISENIVETEAKGKGQRDTEYNTRFFGTSNNVLFFDSGVAGIDRRLKYIRFSREIPSNEIDENLVSKISHNEKEMEGLFLFAIQGYKTILENKNKDTQNWRAGFYQSNDSLLAKEEVEYKSRPVYQFLKDLDLQPANVDYTISLAGLVEVYAKWAEDNGHEQSAKISQNLFSRQFSEYISQKFRISKTVQANTMKKRVEHNTKTVYAGLSLNKDTLDVINEIGNEVIINEGSEEIKF